MNDLSHGSGPGWAMPGLLTSCPDNWCCLNAARKACSTVATKGKGLLHPLSAAELPPCLGEWQQPGDGEFACCGKVPNTILQKSMERLTTEESLCPCDFLAQAAKPFDDTEDAHHSVINLILWCDVCPEDFGSCDGIAPVPLTFHTQNSASSAVLSSPWPL